MAFVKRTAIGGPNRSDSSEDLQRLVGKTGRIELTINARYTPARMWVSVTNQVGSEPGHRQVLEPPTIELKDDPNNPIAEVVLKLSPIGAGIPIVLSVSRNSENNWDITTGNGNNKKIVAENQWATNFAVNEGQPFRVESATVEYAPHRGRGGFGGR